MNGRGGFNSTLKALGSSFYVCYSNHDLPVNPFLRCKFHSVNQIALHFLFKIVEPQIWLTIKLQLYNFTTY